jgi:hypothetical protein
VIILNFLKKRARYLRLVAQNNKADGFNVPPITVVASIDPELLENVIDMEKIDADSVDDSNDESVMEYLKSTQERDVSVTGEYVKAQVLEKVSFTMSEKDPALRVTKAVADYHSLHKSLRLDFIDGMPKTAVEHLVSVIKPATLKTLLKSKQEIDKSDLKKEFLEFVAFLEKTSIINDEHCHMVDPENTGDSKTNNTTKGSYAGGRKSGQSPGNSPQEVAANEVWSWKVVRLEWHWQTVHERASALS